MANPLLQVPGLGGYIASQEQARQQQMGQLQQAQALMGLQGAMEAKAREQAYRQEITALGANPTQEQLAGVASKYGSPADVLKVHQSSLDRKAAAEAKASEFAQSLNMRQQQLDQQREAFLQRTEDTRARQAFEEFYKRSQLQLNAERTQLNAQMQSLGLELKRQGQQIQLEKFDVAERDRLNRDVQQLGTALERANLPESDAVLRGVEDALKKTPDLAEYLSGPKSLLPDLAVSQNVREGRQAAQKLFNITLKTRSGAAVTIPEFERLKQEFATGAWKTPQQFRAGIEQARKIISDHYRSVSAGFRPEALQSYNENLRNVGGTPLLEKPETQAVEDPLGIR